MIESYYLFFFASHFTILASTSTFATIFPSVDRFLRGFQVEKLPVLLIGAGSGQTSAVLCGNVFDNRVLV